MKEDLQDYEDKLNNSTLFKFVKEVYIKLCEEFPEFNAFTMYYYYNKNHILSHTEEYIEKRLINVCIEDRVITDSKSKISFISISINGGSYYLHRLDNLYMIIQNWWNERGY